MGTYDMAEDIRVEVIVEPNGEIYLSWCSFGLVGGKEERMLKALMPLALSFSLALR